MKSNNGNNEKEQPCRRGFWIGDRAESWWRMCLWLVPVHYVNPSQSCPGKQRDEWLLRAAVHNTKLNTSQKLGTSLCKSSDNKTSRPLTCSQARTSDRMATPAPSWEHCNLPANTQHLFYCFTTWILLIVFHRLVCGWVCTLPGGKFCLYFSDGRFYCLHYLISSKGYFWQKCYCFINLYAIS